MAPKWASEQKQITKTTKKTHAHTQALARKKLSEQ